MRRIGYWGILLMVLSFCAACTFKNDMSYPLVQGQITAFAVEGQKSVNINPETQTVEVLLQETAEIKELKVTEFAITENTTIENAPGDVINLSKPLSPKPNSSINTALSSASIWESSSSVFAQSRFEIA